MKLDVQFVTICPGWAVYAVTLTDATEADTERARRILDAAVLAIEDKAPALFEGQEAPLNTNQSDIGNYRDLPFGGIA